ncbi:MAG TPA: SpoVG family protein [Pirellulales bacterium]
MEITEVRIKLMEEAGERLQGFCSITLDNCFVVRDLKIIEGSSGPFVAMPSRKLTAHCPGCGCKNHLRAAYCNQCGGRLRDDRVAKDEEGRAKLYADIAHPINPACRELIQERVIRAFREEIERSKLPGYVSSYDDFDEDLVMERPPRRPRPAMERPAASRVVVERQAVEKTKIETAEPEPRPPHKRVAQPVNGTPAPKRDTFGAGIW